MGNVSVKPNGLKSEGRQGSEGSKLILEDAVHGNSNDESLQVVVLQGNKCSQRSTGDIDLESLLNRVGEDAFTKAVLSFCAHMGGRLDTLDNERLYDEFCSYTANHRQSLSVS